MNENLLAQFHDWQRLSPWSILYFISRTINNFLDPNILFIAAPLYGMYQLLQNNLLFIILLAILIPGGIVGYATASYLFFKYRIHQDKLQISKGLLFKSEIDLPFERIQDVRIDKPFYFKPIGLVSATIDSAGSSEQEAVLAAIPHFAAMDLRERILAKSGAQQNNDATEETESSVPPSADLLLTRSAGDLVIHGISNNKAWVIMAALFPLIDNLLEGMAKSFIDTSAANFTELAQISYWFAGLLLFTGIFSIVMIMMVLSVAGSVISYYGFQLSQQNGTLSRESGLFTRHQVNLKQRRLQYISIQQGLIDRLFGRFNVYFHQVSDQHAAAQQQNKSFIVPSVTEEQVRFLCQKMYPDCAFSLAGIKQRLTPISARYIGQQILLTTLPVTLAIAVFLEMNGGESWFNYLAIVFAVGCLLNYLRWKKWGYWKLNDYLLIRKGLLGSIYTLFPNFKAQQVTIKQSLLMERNEHCQLQIVVGASTMKIPYFPLSEGLQLADTALYHVESSQRSWM